MSAPADDDGDAVHGVDRLPGDAENAARAMDEIVADSDEDGGDTDEDVPDQPEDDYESDGDDQEWALGFCERAPAETLQRQFFPSKVGGRPAWLDPVDVPTAAQLKCLYTREPLDFLLQVYASVDDEPTAPIGVDGSRRDALDDRTATRIRMQRTAGMRVRSGRGASPKTRLWTRSSYARCLYLR